MPASAFTANSDPSDPGSYAGGAVVITTRRKSASPCTPRTKAQAQRRALSSPRLGAIPKDKMDDVLRIASEIRVRPGRASQAQPSDGDGDSSSSVAIHAQNAKAIGGTQTSAGGQSASGASAGTPTGERPTPGGQSASGGKVRSQSSRRRGSSQSAVPNSRLTLGDGAPYTHRGGHGQHRTRGEDDAPPTGAARDWTAGATGARSMDRLPSPAAALGTRTGPDLSAQAGSGTDHLRPTIPPTRPTPVASQPIADDYQNQLKIEDKPNVLPHGTRHEDYVDNNRLMNGDGKYVDANGADSIQPAIPIALGGPQTGGNAAQFSGRPSMVPMLTMDAPGAGTSSSSTGPMISTSTVPAVAGTDQHDRMQADSLQAKRDQQAAIGPQPMDLPQRKRLASPRREEGTPRVQGAPTSPGAHHQIAMPSPNAPMMPVLPAAIFKAAPPDRINPPVSINLSIAAAAPPPPPPPHSSNPIPAIDPEKVTMRKNLEDLGKRFEEAQQRHTQASAEKDAIIGQQAQREQQTRAELDAAHQQTQQLNQRLNLAGQQAAHLNDHCRAYDRRVEELDRSLGLANTQAAWLAQRAQQEKERADQNAQSSSTNEQRANITAQELLNLRQQADAMRSQNETLQSSLIEARNETKKAQDLATHWKSEFDRAMADNKKHTESIKCLELQSQQTNGQLNEVRRELQDMQTKMDNACNNYATIVSERDQLRGRVATLNTQLFERGSDKEDPLAEAQIQQLQQQLQEARSLAVTLSENNQQLTVRDKQWDESYNELRQWAETRATQLQQLESRMDSERDALRDKVIAECKDMMAEKLQELAKSKDAEIKKITDNLSSEQEKWNRAKDSYINEISKLNGEIEELSQWWNEETEYPELGYDDEDEDPNTHNMAEGDSSQDDDEDEDGDDIEDEYNFLDQDEQTKEAVKKIQADLAGLMARLSTPGGQLASGGRRSPSKGPARERQSPSPTPKKVLGPRSPSREPRGRAAAPRRINASAEEDDDEAETYASYRRREADKVTVPALPTITQIAAWFQELISNLVRASSYTDQKEIAWIMSTKSKTFEELAKVEERFLSLDAKLADALRAMIKAAGIRGKTLHDTVFVKTEEALKEGRILRGVQIIRLILEHNATDHHMDTVYDITQFSQLQWMGDKPDDMHRFRTTVHYMLANLKGNHEEGTKAEILLKIMRKSKVLQASLIEYDNDYDKDPTHSFAKLDRYMERYIARKWREANDQAKTDDIAKIAANGVHLAAPGVGANQDDWKGKGKGKGGKDGKKKGKGKGKDGKGKKPKAKAKSKGGGQGGGSGKPAEKVDKQCIFFNKGKCKKGNECGYNHNENEKKKWIESRKANQGRSQSTPPAAPATGGDDKAKLAALEARNKDLLSRLSKPKYCQAYITTGCFDPACNILHVEKAEVDKYKASQKALAAARQKAKKQARSQSVPS